MPIASPFIMGVPNRNQPFSPFGTMTPQVDTSLGNPVETAIGTTVESAIDTLTFGLWQPDIIPEEQEQQDPVATMFGRISGNIAGFVPMMEFGAMPAATRLLGAFGWGRTLRAGMSMTKGATALHGLAQTGTAFAIHDVAREFVKQVKEQDADAYAMGDAAIRGMVGGGIFGFIGGYAAHAAPVRRLVYDGVAMMAADAVNMAAEGDNPYDHPKELAQSFLLGAAMAVPSLVNWRGKRIDANSEQMRTAENLRRMFADPNSSTGKQIETVTKRLGIDKEPEIVRMLTVLKSSEKPKKMKTVESISEIDVERMRWGKDLNTPVSAGHRGRLKQIQKQLGIGDEMWRDMLGSVTAERTRTSTELTSGEAKRVMSDLISYSGQYVSEANEANMLSGKIRKAAGLGEQRTTEYGGLSGVMKFTPVDKVLEKMGMGDFLSDPTRARRYMDSEVNAVGNEIKSAIDMFETASGTGTIEGVKTAVFNRPSQGIAALEAALEISNPAELRQTLRGFNKAQRQAYLELRKITNFYFNRTNETRRFLGLDEIKDRAGYLRKVMKAPVADEVGLTYEQVSAQMKPGTKNLEEAVNPTALPRKDTAVGEAAFTGKDRLYRRMMNMVHHDAKEIYLHQPTRAVKAAVDNLTKVGAMTDAEARYTVEYMKNFVLAEPTESWKKMDVSFKQFLKGTHIEDTLNGIMSKFNINREIGDRPATQLINMFGRGVGAGMIAGRPSLAFRNMFQGFLPHAFASTKSVAKGMLYGMNEEMSRRMETSDIYQKSLTMMEEGISARGIMGASAVDVVKKTSGMAYYEIGDKILADATGKHGYSTKSGRALRAQAKKGEAVFSEDEWATRIIPEAEYYINTAQFMYDLMGMPGTFSTPGGKVLFKLQSWPMNYMFKYLDEGVHRAKTGYRSWDTKHEMKLTNIERYGIVKHFVGMSLIVNALAQIGLDYTSIGGITPTYTKEEGFDIKLGAMTMRPSPGASLINGIQKLWSDDEYERKEGFRAVKWIMAPVAIPGYLAGREVFRAIERGERKELLFKTPRKPGRRAGKTVHGISSPFRPISLTPPKPFKNPFGE